MKDSYLQLIKRLDEFASAFSTINTLEQMIEAVENILEKTFNVDYTGLYLYDSSEKRLKLHFAKGFDQEEFLDADRSAMDRHPGLVFQTGKMIYISDTLLDQKQLTRSSKRSFVVRSRLYLPVMNGNQPVGAFGIVNSEPDAFNDEDIALLSFICNLAGVLYGNIFIQANLRKNEAMHTKMVANIDDVIVIIDGNGINTYKSPNVEKLFGWKSEELVGLNALHNIHPEDHEGAVQTLGHALSIPNQTVVSEFRYRCKDGSYKWVHFTGVNLIEDPDIMGILGNYHDITEQKEAEEDLNKLYRALEQSPSMTYITNLDGTIEYVNPKVVELTGFSRDELIGKNPRIFSSGESTNLNYENLWKTIKSGKEWKGEFHNKKKNGEFYWVMASLSPVFDQKGKITHFVAIEEDITRRIEDYEALQIANLRFKSLITSIQAGIMVEDEHRRVVLVNQYFCDLFSIPLPPEQLIGISCAEAAQASKIMFSDSEAFIRDIDHTLIIRRIITNHELQMKNGTSLERDFIPIGDYDNENQGILWIYRDITKRKNSERDLLRQSEILNGTAKAMNYLLTIHDHGEAMQKALEAVGIATDADRAYIFECNSNKIKGETFLSQQFEWTAKGIQPQIDNPELQNMPFSTSFPRWYELLSNGKTLSGFVREFPENERQLLDPQDIISLIVVPVFVNDQFWGTVGFDDCSKGIQWSSNEVSILTALAASIGGSISRELIGRELTNARLIAEKATKTKSDFLATMSHEIRTPMNGVIGMTSLLLQTPLTPDQIEYAETIKISGELLLDLINEILDFAKIESGKMVLEEQQFDLRLAIEDTIDLTAPAAVAKKLGLYFTVDPAIPQMISGDLTRLRQILVNLVGNAIKFTDQGEVVISVIQKEIEANKATLEFTVKDTGIGISREKIEKLFKPFSQVDPSTTRKYGGSGLGLAICTNLIKLMNGEISVKSTVNYGSEFIFTIQTSYAPEDKNNDKMIREREKLAGKKILIIDSHLTSNTLLVHLFNRFEIEAVSVASAEMGIKETIEPGGFDVILIDNDLPDMDGISLISSIKKLKVEPDVRLVLFAYPNFTENGAETEQISFVRLSKPVKQSQLISNIRNLLSDNQQVKIKNNIQSSQLKKFSEMIPLKILVAEDNAINQKLILRLFEMLGYSIQIAANGYEVIEILNRMKIDIVFMDIQMPEMDGYEATKQIISKWGDRKPLIVAMTANALASDREKCMAAGMDDYVSKPLTIEQIRNGLQRWSAMLINEKV
jgi:PAS domain S-box-containing protein